MNCKCCGASSESSCVRKSSSYCASSSSDEEQHCYQKQKRKIRRPSPPTAWEEEEEYCGNNNSGLCKINSACRGGSCRKVTKHGVDKKCGKYYFPQVETNVLEACTVAGCSIVAKCVQAQAGQIGTLNIKDRLLVDGKDITSNNETAIVSNIVGDQSQIPINNPQDALFFPVQVLVPQGVLEPIPGSGNSLPKYVALFNFPDRRSINMLSELKQLYSKIVLHNVGQVARQVSFVLFILSRTSLTSTTLGTINFVLQPLDISTHFILPLASQSYEVQWNSWRSSLNLVRDASSVSIFTAVMTNDEPSDLSFLRTYNFSSPSLNYNIYAVYDSLCSTYSDCCDNGDRCRRDDGCNNDDCLV